MSFDLDMGQIMQYGYNIFGSFMPLVYIFVGAAFAIWLVKTIINSFKGEK